jgi:hypothetical protein
MVALLTELKEVIEQERIMNASMNEIKVHKTKQDNRYRGILHAVT